jgi:hypothetical protein
MRGPAAAHDVRAWARTGPPSNLVVIWYDSRADPRPGGPRDSDAFWEWRAAKKEDRAAIKRALQQGRRADDEPPKSLSETVQDVAHTFLVGRGSMVRVRQRASRKASKWPFLLPQRRTRILSAPQPVPQELSPTSQ